MSELKQLILDVLAANPDKSLSQHEILLGIIKNPQFDAAVAELIAGEFATTSLGGLRVTQTGMRENIRQNWKLISSQLEQIEHKPITESDVEEITRQVGTIPPEDLHRPFDC